jgi:2,3,4,5-tetrahydropyridine-2,6-dicarboxylate N-succinyltransferase
MSMTQTDLQTLIEDASSRHELLDSNEYRSAVEETIDRLDQGDLRMAEKVDDEWVVNSWVQKAILLYFRTEPIKTMQSGPFEYHDKIPIKHDLASLGIRAVPGAIIRYGSFIEPGVVVAPGFVNTGAYVGTGSLVDTWATVGSGAQVGRNVHIAGGVGIGGVLEPAGAKPVIVEDGAFLGSRCILVEGVVVEERAVLAAQVCLTSSTHIIDMSQDEPVTYRGRVPAGSLVIPGTRKRKFPGGEAEMTCALIIGKRTDSTDGKVALSDDLRDFAFG